MTKWTSGPPMKCTFSSMAPRCRMWVPPETKDPVLLP